jgi:rod shape-determining protein MreD
MIRFLVYTIEIIICFVLQSSLFHYISLAGVMPNLILILVVSTAYMRGRLPGLLVGFFSGLLVDLFYGSTVGLYALMYMLIGYLAGYANRIYSEDDYTLPLIFVGAADLLYTFFYYVFEFLLRSRLNLPFYFIKFMLPEVIYTIAASVIVYKLLNGINSFLDRKLKQEE